MLKVQDIKNRIGFKIIPAVFETPEETEEVPNPEPIQIQPEVDESVGYHFYYMPKEDAKGENITRYAMSVVGGACFVFEERGIIYFATKSVAPSHVSRVPEE